MTASAQRRISNRLARFQINYMSRMYKHCEQALTRLLRVHRYPKYLEDLWTNYVFPRLLCARGARLSPGIHFYGLPIVTLAPNSHLEIGRGATLCSRSHDTALGINHPVVLRTLWPGAKLVLGSGVRMSGTTICAAKSIVIGDRCVIGANVTIVDTDFHSLDPAVRSSQKDADAAQTRPVKIGCDVFIGGGSYILKGVCVGDGAVIGAASVVTRSVPPRSIFAGNPARQIGTIDPT